MRSNYTKSKNIPLTLVGEVGGTSLLGGLCAYTVAVLLMGKSASEVAFYAYIIPVSYTHLCGDGSYLMLHSELVTSIQEHKKINVLLFDNSGFGCINLCLLYTSRCV